MKNGRQRVSLIFDKKRFWPSVLWVLILVLGIVSGCIFRSPEIIAAAVLAAFLGLNETSRWAYKINLLTCTAAVAVGTMAGVFPLLRTVFIFILLFVVYGYMLYFRDSTQRLLPYFEKFSSALSAEKDLDGTITLAVDTIGLMSGGETVFIAISDGEGGLYLPTYHDDKRINLKRNGGSVWKVFASGRPFVTNKIDISKDLPLDREARSLMSVPLLMHGEKLGVLQVESDYPNTFTDYDLSKLEMLAFIISHSIFSYLSPPMGGGKISSDIGKAERPVRTRAGGLINDSTQAKLDLELPPE